MVFLDAIVVKVRDNHTVQAKPAYVAIGVDTDGDKHVLGIWLAKIPLDAATASESARFWTSKDNAPSAGAKHLTSSRSPIQDESSNRVVL
ncbi:transposase [Nonomuraea wenchangensis]